MATLQPRRGASYSEKTDNDLQASSLPSSMGPTGLHRIRSHVPSRHPTLPRSSSAYETRPTMTISIPELTTAEIRANPGPMTSGLAMVASSAIEDVHRFPVESLHSFSFTNQADETIHARHSVLKRSLDLWKDKSGWSASQIGIAQAQARVNGDSEAQTAIELLAKAESKVGRQRAVFDLGGSMTGPSNFTGENVFEKEFMTRSESPPVMEQENLAGNKAPVSVSSDDSAPTPTQNTTLINTLANRGESLDDERLSMADRGVLRRAYTDTGPLDLHNRLTDVLAESHSSPDPNLLSPTVSSPMLTTPSIFPNTSSYAHGRAFPASQAIFTTGAEEPWTITAANDLACLMFGVTKAEVRKIGILELVNEDKRKWLRQKLKPPPETPQTPTPPRSPPSPRPNGLSSSLGNGITARLLSKPSSRETGQGRRGRSGESASPSPTASNNSPRLPPKTVESRTNRGVLICGDVLRILKRNGATGSASCWVSEKSSGLIWVMEEVAEDVAFLRVDEIGCVDKGFGALEGVWGMERVKPGVDVARLIPGIPRRKDTNTGALDFDKIAEWRRFTARTANDISIPVTIDQLSGESTLRISSFPNIAGMIVLSASTLTVTSSNAVVSDTLFGRSPTGEPMNQLIPGFDKMLELLVEYENVRLDEGKVIPEHSFRKARSLLAAREGKADAAMFLKPSGVPAIHRDGAEIMVDIQMRVVKGETFGDISNTSLESSGNDSPQTANLVYAVWVTYSRTLHAVNHGVGPISPLMSRPGTPPHQPAPDHTLHAMSSGESDIEDSGNKLPPPVIDIESSQKVEQHTEMEKPAEKPTEPAAPHKKSIADFQILEEMGAGAYGQVKLARNKIDGSTAVIKYVTKRRILVDTWTRDRRLGTVPLEIHVLDYLRRDGYKHPNIVEMSDFFEDSINYYIEMVPHGLPGMDLFDYIELRENMEEAECKRIFVQVASAVEFLHTKARVVHRDIKDENVILDGEGRVKLIDFGSASYIKNGPFDVFVGTIDYASPEVLAGRSYTGPEQDIWALGILLYTIIYKENPFYSIDEIIDHALRVPFVVSDDSIALVRLMLERDVASRVTIKQIVEHPWFKGVDLPPGMGAAEANAVDG